MTSVPLAACFTRRDALPEVEPVPLRRGKTGQRQYRLERRIDQFVQAVTYTGRAHRRVWLLLLTTRERDPSIVQGHISRFWHALRDKYGVITYFSWLEVCADGAAHYHALWVDPPRWALGNGWRELEQVWQLGFVKVRVKPRAWFQKRGGAYVKSEAKKTGWGRYQHNYDRIPSTIRTFQCADLGYPGRLLDQHRDRKVVQVVAPHSVMGQWRDWSAFVWAIDRHVAPHRCTLGPPRYRLRAAARAGRAGRAPPRNTSPGRRGRVSDAVEPRGRPLSRRESR